jgi:uncharacterized membrane protein
VKFQSKEMRKKTGCSAFFIIVVQQVSACPFCNPQIRDAIYDDRFLPNLAAMLSAFIVLGILVAVLSALANKRHKTNLSRHPTRAILTPVPLLTTAIVLGIGIGGFIDGIVLHQILQWHEMLSARIPPTNYVNKSVNMFWDGIFHAFTLIVTFIGVVLLWKLLYRKNIDRSGYLLSGGLLSGWGIFNIVEGIIDHQVLKLHNVREISNNPEAWNVGFLGLSLVMIAAGYLLVKQRKTAQEQIGSQTK